MKYLIALMLFLSTALYAGNTEFEKTTQRLDKRIDKAESLMKSIDKRYVKWVASKSAYHASRMAVDITRLSLLVPEIKSDISEVKRLGGKYEQLEYAGKLTINVSTKIYKYNKELKQQEEQSKKLN